MMLTRNFSLAEVQCRCGCGLANIDLSFMERVQELRDVFAAPMTITSGVRCEAHNKAIRGAANSYHVGQGARLPMALDIKIVDSLERYRFLKLAMVGFNGVGIDESFIHIDGRSSVPVCWLY